MNNNCNQNDGIELCKILYEKLSPMGYFPALTGGLLYKEGHRKDIDILLYRHRQMYQEFETIDIRDALEEVDVVIIKSFGFVTKATWRGFEVDIFNPENKKWISDFEYGDKKNTGESLLKKCVESDCSELIRKFDGEYCARHVRDCHNCSITCKYGKDLVAIESFDKDGNSIPDCFSCKDFSNFRELPF